MTERIVRPVRAWADYDQWSVYLEGFEGQVVHGWENVVIPKGNRDWIHERGVYSGIADFAEGFGAGIVKPGPLRSLRVLYENDCELKVQRRFGGTFWGWSMELSDEFNEIKAPWPGGFFAEDKDSEAVERAMIAAAAWFSQRQEQR